MSMSRSSCLIFLLALFHYIRGDTLQLPYTPSETGPCPSNCEQGKCRKIAVQGKFFPKDVLEDCTKSCSSPQWASKGFGTCWGTGYSTDECEYGNRNQECQCQKFVQTEVCYKVGETVDGDWATWSKWTECSKVCDRGSRSRWRLCNNPPPKYGGKTCHGNAREEENCNIESCRPCRFNVSSDCPASWIPHYKTAGEGFDIMTLQRQTTNIIEMTQFGKCEKHRETNECLRVPASVQEWKYRPKCTHSIVEETYSSVKELNEMQEDYVSESWKVGLDGKVEVPFTAGLVSVSAEGSAAGSNSKLSNWARHQAESSKTHYQNIELNCELYDFNLSPSNTPLTNEFSNSLKILPPLLTVDTVRNYELFLHDFGTHYFDKLTLGGKIKSLTAMLESQLDEYDMSSSEAKDCLSMEAKARLGISVVKLIDVGLGASGEYNKCTRKSSISNQYLYTSEFISKRSYEVKGGSLGTQADLLFSPSTQINFHRWLADIVYNPGVYKYSTRPLFMLVDQINREQKHGQRPLVFHNLTKKADNLRKVTILYVARQMNETNCDILDIKPDWCNSAACQCLGLGLTVATWFIHIFNLN